MRYFEKVFDGQVLKWCVNGTELGGGKPTLLCLVSNEPEAESCLSKLEPHCGEAQVTALILPGGILPETAVQSLVFEWQTTGIIDKCKLSLTASQSCADAAWQPIRICRIASARRQFSAGTQTPMKYARQNSCR